MAADSIGVTPTDTGEFLLGRVAVTPVFFESNGQIDTQTQNWDTEEIDHVLAKITDSVNWWSDTLDTLNTVHSLEFVIDDTYAVNPVETPYEPIDRSSSDFNLYVGDFITDQGYGDVNSIEEGVRRFNNAQRDRLDTDWSFTIFVTDSSDDGDGLFASGGTFAGAFAFAGGLFYISPSTRPVTTFTHEMGHIFWARDEYSGGGSWTDTRGYYNAQNLNAADNPTPGFVQDISILRGGVPLTAAFEANYSPASTLALVGWQDSDGDGVFDLADVPLSLDAIGYFDSDTNLYHFEGAASAVPLINQNSSGPQSDITLNRVSELQYRLDDGPWLVADSPDQQRVEFDLAVPIDQVFDSIQWRAIDLTTGITSDVIDGSAVIPAITRSSVSGIAFVDENADGQRGEGEAVLDLGNATIRNADGSALFSGGVVAEGHSDGELPGDLSGVTITTDGFVSDVHVGSFVSDDSNVRVFHSFDLQRNRWIDEWSERAVFEASFAEDVGEVSLDALGLRELSFARLEAYDRLGNLIGRTTSDLLTENQSVTIRVEDSLGRIASIRAMGHADTSIAISSFAFGFSPQAVTNDSGALRFENLPDGEYQIELIPERVIHQVDSVIVEVTGGTSDFLPVAAERVDSHRFNSLLAEDANGDGTVSSRDALVIINDLSRNDPRILQSSETGGFDVDVSNDGAVSARDALLVINYLGRAGGESEQGESEQIAGLESSFEFPSLQMGLESDHVPATQYRQTQPKPDQPTFVAAKMLDFEGGGVRDESGDPSIADTSDQPMVGQLLANKIIDSSLVSPQFDTGNQAQPHFNEDLRSKSALELPEINESIRSENSEPFE